MLEKTKNSIIFADVDGTLVFRQGVHDISVINDIECGISQVRIGCSSNLIDANRLASAPGTKAYIAIQTRELAKGLMDQADIYIATAGNPNLIKKRRMFFDFVRGFILQSGGGIYDANLKRDEEWHNHLASERELVPDLKKLLTSKNITFKDNWEDAALRIQAKNNPHLSQDFGPTIEELELPEGLKLTSNLGHYDIILESAGKENAAGYIINRDGYKKSNSYAIGDDINDMDLLKMVKYGYVLGSGYPEVIEHAHKNNLYVSEGLYFDGINEILEKIRRKIIAS